MSDIHKHVTDTIYIDCPHWTNEYHEAWKLQDGLSVELTPPGKEEYTLRLCPICTRLVEAELLRRIQTKAVRAHWLDSDKDSNE